MFRAHGRVALYAQRPPGRLGTGLAILERPRRCPRCKLADASSGLGQPLLGHGRADRRENAFDLLGGQDRAETKRVCAGRERAHGRVIDFLGPAGALHLECVGHHDAVEAELGAQQLDHGRVPGRRRLAEGAEADVRGHYDAHPSLDRSGERREGALAQDVEARLGRRQLQMRVGDRLAVAGKVLGAGRDADALQTLDEGRDLARHDLWVGAERAHADDRARRVDQHVGHRREVEVDPDRRQLAADRRADAPR